MSDEFEKWWELDNWPDNPTHKQISRAAFAAGQQSREAQNAHLNARISQLISSCKDAGVDMSRGRLLAQRPSRRRRGPGQGA
jgi:hypothetical protein